MTFKTDDRIYETSITTGTGTYTLDGAATGFQAFSAVGAANIVPYFATDDTNWEVGLGTVLSAPARLERTTILASSNADAAVNWGAGTRKLRCGLPAAMAIPRTLSKSVAGSSDVTLTQDEQRRDQLVFTGILTGNISVIVDATPWKCSVYNNTTGAFTLTFKTTPGSGISVPQGRRMTLECDGTNIVAPASGKTYKSAAQTITSSGTLTLAHGLGEEPWDVSAVLECTTAEFGYSIGHRIFKPLNVEGTDIDGDPIGNRGAFIRIDATNLYVRFASGSAIFLALDTSNLSNALTNASWTIEFRARGR